MTENTETAEPVTEAEAAALLADPAVMGEASATPADETETETAEPGRDNREAAKWRIKLREAETALTGVQAERDALAESVRATERAQVSTVAAEVLIDGSDLLRLVELDDLRGDGGAIDPVKVTAALDDIARERPHWLAAGRMPSGRSREYESETVKAWRRGGDLGGARAGLGGTEAEPTWQQAFKSAG